MKEEGEIEIKKDLEEKLIKEDNNEEEKKEEEIKESEEKEIIKENSENEKIKENINIENEEIKEKKEKEEDKIIEPKNEDEKKEEFENIEKHEINRKDRESDKNIIRYSTSDVELFGEFAHKISGEELNENIDEFLENNKNRFRHINPLRIRSQSYKKQKIPEDKLKTKQMAIKELVTNLKTQYILFNVKDFIRQYQIKSNPKINTKVYKLIRILRNFCLYFYGIVMLFERPWFCYKDTTIPVPPWFNFIEDCDKKIEFMNIPFIHNDLLRAIEIIQTVIIIITQIVKYKDEYNLKKTNTGINKSYNIIQIISFISLFLSLLDLILSLSLKKFPIINFILRPFIYIFMIRRLRMNWTSILKVIWKTKKAYCALFINMITFSIIGYVLFKKEKGFFESFIESVLQLYILLSTCNFPDIMLEAMDFSKFAVLYFVIYISINYFILLSYLKTLYTTKYYEINKRDCLSIIKYNINNKYNKHIFYGKQFNKFILEQKKLYRLNDDEYNNLLIIFNLYDKNSETFNELMKIVDTTLEIQMISKSKYGKYILKSKKFEIAINIICIISTAVLFTKNIISLIFHFLVSICLLFEPVILTKHLGIKRFIGRHFNRVIFHIFNLVVLICVVYLFSLDQDKEEEKITFENIFKILRIFISLRTIRLFVFLDKFRIIKNIYIIIRVSKEMLYRNLLLLYSFILLFSTLSILLTGGNIKKNSFDDENDAIPQGYVHINFNDFASSYISCFCLLMINNLNILVKSLTFQSRHKMFFQFYFATFYFFSTLILINIIQTLLLEMYLISDHSLSDKDKKKEIMEKIEEKKEEYENNNDSFPILNNKEKDGL